MGPNPPWRRWHPHDHDHEFRWRHKPHKPGRLFFRFILAFGFIVLFILGAMSALGYLFSRFFGVAENGHMAQRPGLLRFGTVFLAIMLFVVAARVARRAFQRIATPLAGLMSAADAVAEGDLSARVPVRGSGEFAQLAQSFNRMAEELERADQRRRNLTADVAHELRTPLQIIQGNLEGVLDEVYRPTEDHIEATLEETRLLARLVEDLRTLSLAEAGELPMTWEPVDIAELLADVRTSFSGQAEAAGIELRAETNGTQPEPIEDAASLPTSALTVTGDFGRLAQVLGNLLANAIRHTPAGGSITLQAEAISGGVRITVRDSGTGIPPEDLPYIFDRFWKGDRSRTHSKGAGSGLGLAIARQLVQAHGGRIQAESEVGQGTTFTVDLPENPPAARQA
jgi:two-component system OmpR family sensor kinase/two-component system sensor histidine kinase BaeS